MVEETSQEIHNIEVSSFYITILYKKCFQEEAKIDLMEEVSEKVEVVEPVVKPEQAARPTTPSLDEIASFDKSSLKATETAEKSTLPTVVDIAQEKLPREIDEFDKAGLRQVETEEKGILPTPPQIAQEKTLEEITSFDKSNLQPVPETEPTHEVYGSIIIRHLQFN